MSGLIKAARHQPEIAAFTVAKPRAAPAIPAPSAAERALEEARDEIARLHAALEEQRLTAAQQESRAYERGTENGRATADDGVARHVAQIEAALRAARADLDHRLIELEALAVQLARAALARLFADSTDLADLTCRAIALKLAALREHSVVTIVVGACDFGAPERLDQLRTTVGDARIAIVADAALAAGACRLDLDLGHVDLTLATLAREADEALASLVPAPWL